VRTLDDLLVLDEPDAAQDRGATRDARELRRIARLASLDPGDGLSL
jgi:energy-coupling factor transporter ATP-binding protein EcfA2